MQLKAHSAVILCLGDKVLREVQAEKMDAAILAKLDAVYMAKSLANRLYMKRRLYSYSFVEDTSIIEQLEDFDKVVDDLENIDVSISDEDKAILLLNVLPKSHDQLRDAIMFGREGTITLLEVQTALRAKELQRAAGRGLEQVPESLNIKMFKGKKNFKKDRDDSKSATKDHKETRSCHWCKKPGHLKRDCFAWKKKQAEEAAQSKNSSDFIQENESSEALNVMEQMGSTSWILDSGCSFHICPNAHWFETLNEASGSVVLGNNQVCDIRGIGSVRLKFENNSVKTLSDVRYIPEVKRNLISLGMLEVRGCSFESSGGRMVIKKGTKVMFEGARRGSLYYVDATVLSQSDGETNSIENNTVRLWHMWLGHPTEGSIKELIKKAVM